MEDFESISTETAIAHRAKYLRYPGALPELRVFMIGGDAFQAQEAMADFDGPDIEAIEADTGDHFQPLTFIQIAIHTGIRNEIERVSRSRASQRRRRAAVDVGR